MPTTNKKYTLRTEPSEESKRVFEKALIEAEENLKELKLLTSAVQSQIRGLYSKYDFDFASFDEMKENKKDEVCS